MLCVVLDAEEVDKNNVNTTKMKSYNLHRLKDERMLANINVVVIVSTSCSCSLLVALLFWLKSEKTNKDTVN